MPELIGYYGVTADRMAQDHRYRQRKLARLPHLRHAIVERIRHGWSPEQIAGRLKLEHGGSGTSGMHVCHETIYRFVHSRDGLAIRLWQHLPERRARRRTRHARRRHGRRFSPELIRKTFGKANVTSLVERVSRFTVFLRNNDRQSRPIMERLIAALGPLPQMARRSITFDRGTEFTDWSHLQAGLGASTWFCDPQSPWQKGTVENTNGRARRWLPRETNPLAISDEALHNICDQLNSTPRKCLGYRTPAEVFRQKVMASTRRSGYAGAAWKSRFAENSHPAVVGDILDGMGLIRQFLPQAISAITPSTVVIGRAMPVLEVDFPAGMANAGVAGLARAPFGHMFRALDDLKPQESYIATGCSFEFALWGGLMSTRAKQLGAAGAVLNGPHRDTPEILSLDFPVFSRGAFAQDQGARGKVVDFRVSVQIGQARINPGDILYGDRDGILVVPAEAEEEAFRLALEKAHRKPREISDRERHERSRGIRPLWRDVVLDGPSNRIR